MIQVNGLTKKFDSFTALSALNCTIPSGCIYGMVGSNGAGKSTLLRLICGVYKPDQGNVTLDGKNIYENPELKSRLVFVPDELYFLPQSSMQRMAQMYASIYPNFDFSRFGELTKSFKLNPNANLNTFSKGMRRQAATILALSCCTDYLFLDETFDGLDPIMRNIVKKILYADVAERGATAVITSHSLRELEDTCDQLALLHRGGLVLESDIQNLKTSLFKLQLGYTTPVERSHFDGIELLSYRQTGSVVTLIVRGDREKLRHELCSRSPAPALLDILPLSLEEVFIYELDALGYTDGLKELGAKEVQHE